MTPPTDDTSRGVRPMSSEDLCQEPGAFIEAHSGPSMNPTLCAMDVLEVLPYGDRPIRTGDVICFQSPDTDGDVIHRVLRIDAGGILTLGDNNREVDPWRLEPEHVKGRVVAAWRGPRRRRLAGARRGRVEARWVRIRKRLDAFLALFLRPIYQGLGRTGLVRRLAPASWRPRLVTFTSPHGRHWRLIAGKRVVGYFHPHSGQWRINRPYHLLVDVQRLPVPCRAISVEDAAHRWIVGRLGLEWGHDVPEEKALEARPAFWEAVKQVGKHHKVLGQLYSQSLRHPACFPKDLARWLRLTHSASQVLFEHWRNEIVDLFRRLDAEGIPFMLLKGWVLLFRHYDSDIGRRNAEDVDLLMPAEHVERAVALMDGLGFRCPTKGLDLWPGHMLRFRNEVGFFAPGSHQQALMVEFHWRPFCSHFREAPVADFFERAKAMDCGGVDVLTPAPEDHLVYMCGHAALHHPQIKALHHYHSIAAQAHYAGDALDWDVVLERAKAWRLVIPLQKCLAYVRRCWPALVPEDVWRRIRRLRPTAWEQWLYWWTTRCFTTTSLMTYACLAGMPGVGLRLRFVLEYAFPSRAFMARRYPLAQGRAWPLAYLKRFAVGARRAATLAVAATVGSRHKRQS